MPRGNGAVCGAGTTSDKAKGGPPCGGARRLSRGGWGGARRKAMRKYRNHLEEKVEADRKQEREQERLRRLIPGGKGDNGIRVREKGAKDYLIGAGRDLVSIVAYMLVMAGIITLMNPGSRNALLALFR